MGDKLDAKIIKKTQDSLGKIIKKPPLTEKLLNKPPFRFLHDVVTSVIKGTGFMKGLYTDSEMVSENVKERDTKVAFLQKLIDMVSLVLGDTIAAKPTKIVAGQEPERTNELLQLLAKAVNKKINNDDYVQRVLKGGGDVKPPSGSAKKDSDKKKKSKDDEKKPKDDRKDRDRSRDHDREKSRDKGKDKEKSHDKPRDQDRHKSRERRDKEQDRSRDRNKEEDAGRSKDRDRRKRRDDGDDGDRGNQDGQEEPPQRIPRPSSAKGSRRRHGHEDDSTEEEEEHVRQRERERSSRQRDEGAVGEDDLPPQVAAARKMQRPSSARPAPPKVKKNEGQDEPVMMGTSNVPNLITDKDDSDDDDGFMAKEEEEPEPTNIAPQRAPETEEEGEHGGLVKKILETKKGLEGGSQQPGKKTEIERSHASDATRRKEREMIQKEIDKLRTSIQTLTRSVNPLGKILDFLQEDLDSMQKELTVWQAENKDNAVALQRESSITESSIEPLKAQLQELDAAIGDQLDLIAAVKHNTLKNDDKIEKMLSTVTKS